ncbi:MAG: hypothetical protein KDD25_08065, partial [Bdellovibrionales bacterium]|nr:hypothetical protein [Bdellovibrionales bacterium]
SKAKFIQMYDALVDNKTVENVSFESFGRLEAIFVSLNADVNVSASTSGVASASPDGAQTEDEKTKKDNEILKDLEARTSKITAYHLVFPIQNVEQKAIGGISRFYVNNMKADSERSFFSGQLPYRDAMSGKSIDMELQTEKASIEKFKGVRQSISKQSPSFKENLEIVLSNKTDESDAAIELTVTVVKKEDAIPFFAGSVKKNQEPKKTDDASAQDAASDPDKTKAEDVFREDDPSDTANETVPTAQTEGKVYSGSSSEVIDLTTKQPADAAQTPAEPQVEATTQPSTLI